MALLYVLCPAISQGIKIGKFEFNLDRRAGKFLLDKRLQFPCATFGAQRYLPSSFGSQRAVGTQDKNRASKRRRAEASRGS